MNKFKKYLNANYSIGSLIDFGNYGFRNCGCGDLIYTSVAIEKAMEFEYEISEMYDEYGLDPEEVINGYFPIMSEVFIRLMYGAIELYGEIIEGYLDEAMERLKHYSNDTGVTNWDEIEDNLKDALKDETLEDCTGYELAHMAKLGRDLIDEMAEYYEDGE